MGEPQPADRSANLARRTVQLEASDGVELALHIWSLPDPEAALFYIHGIQSHAGWLFDTGPALASRGVTVYALDRRGSGCSGGRRGHWPFLDVVLDDYASTLARVQDRAGLPLTVVGQSLGGSILAGLGVDGKVAADALVFCAPALGQQRHRHDAEDLAALRSLVGVSVSDVGLADEDYTDQPDYLAFLAGDPLMLRQVTDATRAAIVLLEDRYMDAVAAIEGPVYLATPTRDPIIDLASARLVLAALAPQARERCFDTARHFIEFSSARQTYWDWLASIARSASR